MSTLKWEPYISDIPRFSRRKLGALQKRVGVRLPDDYVADLAAHSGMVREDAVARVLRRRSWVGPLLYVGGAYGQKSYVYSVENTLERLSEWADDFEEVVGVAFWPFAKDGLQGAYCLMANAGSDDAPVVVHVDRELDPDEEHAVIPLADSYREFMASLMPDEAPTATGARSGRRGRPRGPRGPRRSR